MAHEVVYVDGVIADAKTARRAQRRLRRELATPHMRRLYRQAVRRHVDKIAGGIRPGDREAVRLLMGYTHTLRGHGAPIRPIPVRTEPDPTPWALTAASVPVTDLAPRTARQLITIAPPRAPNTAPVSAALAGAVTL